MVIERETQQQLTNIQIELSELDGRLEFAERRTQAIRHQNFVDNFLQGLTDLGTLGFISSHLDWKHAVSPVNPDSGFQRIFADTDNSGHLTSRNSSGNEIDLEYVDADAIAAIEGEATLDLTGDVKVVAGGKFFEAADFRLDSATELTIDGSGDIAITQSYHRIDTASDGSTDNLDGMTGGNDGQILIIRPENDARTVVVRHNQNAANVKNILLADATSATLDDISDYIMLIYDVNLDTNGAWIEIGRSTGASIYTDAKAIAAVEGEDPLNLAGDVFIADLKGLVIGHTAQIDFGATPEFQVLGTATPDSSMGFARFENNASGPDVRFLKSRGATIGANVIVNDGDTLGRFRFQGADGGDFNTTAAEILGKVDGAPALNDIPGSIVFRTRISGGSLADRMTLDDAGNLILTNEIVMADEKFIRMGTADAADNESTGIAGGGALSSIRGSFVRVSGNEDANTGILFLTAGNVTNGEIRLSTGGALKMVVDDAGLVGIGLSSPVKNLHISSTVPTIRLSDSDAGTDQAVATLIEFYRGDNTNRVGFLGMGSSSNDILAIGTDYTAGEIRLSTGSNTLAVTISSSQATTFAGLITGDLGLTISGADFSLDGDLDFVGPQSITTSTGDLTLNPASDVIIPTNVVIGAAVSQTAILRVYENTTGVGTDVGLVVEQDGTGDALLQLLLTGIQRWVIGIDNSVSGDPLAISDTGDLANAQFSFDTGGDFNILTDGSGAGLKLGASSDVHLFRGAADRLDLGTGDRLRFTSTSSATASIFETRVDGDSVNRFIIEAAGGMEWGDGSASRDVRLSRTGNDRLELASGDKFRIATDGSTGTLQFGSGGDAQLFRGATNRLDLASGDSFNIVSGSLLLANIGSGVNAITIRASADADDRVRIRRNKIMWGDGTNTPDIDLSRAAANVLGLASGDSFRLSTDGSTGTLQFGATGDAQLFRGAANRLDLASGDDLLIVSGNLFLGNQSTTPVPVAEGAEVAAQSDSNILRMRFDAKVRSGGSENISFEFGRQSVDDGDATPAGAVAAIWYSPNSSTNSMNLDMKAGQLKLPIGGSGAGLLLGGDVLLYRSATNRLTIPDTLDVESNSAFGDGSAPSTQVTILVDRNYSTTAGGDQLLIRGDTTITGGTSNVQHMAVSGGTIVINSGGVHSFVETLLLVEPNITETSGSVTTASTLRISGAPTEGTNNYALNVDSGNSKFDGDIALDGDLDFIGPQTITTSTGDLTISPAGNLGITVNVALTGGGGGLVQNSTGLGLKLAAWGTTYGIGIQSNLLEFITTSGNADFRWGHGTSGSLTELMFLDSGTGQLKIPLGGSGAGLLIGTDVQLFRGSANRLDLADGDAFLTEVSEVNRDAEATGHESAKHVITSLGGMLNFGQVGYFTIRSGGQSFLGLWADGSVDNPGSGSRGTDTEGRRETIATGTTSGEEAFFDSVDLHQGDNNPMMMFKFRLDQTTDVQVFAGFTSLSAAVAVGSDSPGSHLGLSYSTVRGDSNWQFISGDGLSQNVTDSGIAVDTGVHYVYVYFDQTSGEGQVELFDSSHVFQAGARFTTNLPAAANEMRVAVGLETQTTTNKTMALYYGQGVNRV